ncbi:MAG: hypothetical protein RIQ56_193 [Candidatus Parcubacteria bacterium]|jgi:ferredoxin-NADP reductase
MDSTCVRTALQDTNSRKSGFKKIFSCVAPSRSGELEFAVQLIPEGVLSPKLWRLEKGEMLELYGPLGTNFVWEASMGEGVVLLGAGSGITPLLSICMAHRETYGDTACSFIMSAKSPEKLAYMKSIRDVVQARFTQSDGRIDREFLEARLAGVSRNSLCFVCGPDGFIDAMVDMLLDLGFGEDCIRSERFT